MNVIKTAIPDVLVIEPKVFCDDRGLILEDFAHGFLVISDAAEFLYKTTDYYAPHFECSIIWDDETICIDWPIKFTQSLSGKDLAAKSLFDAEFFN